MSPRSAGRISSELDKIWESTLAEPVGAIRERVFANWISNASVDELFVLLGRTMAVSDPDVRVDLRRVLLARLARTNGPGAVAYLDGLPQLERVASLRAVIVGQWAAKDPEAAVRWLVTPGTQTIEPEVIDALGRVLATQSIETVFHCVTKLGNPPNWTETLRRIIDQWSKLRPTEAADLAVFADAIDGRGEFTGSIISSWADRDLPAVVSWIKHLGDDTATSTALAHLSVCLAEKHPDDIPLLASRFSLEQNAPFFSELAAHWLLRDPLAALQWVLSLPNGEAKERVVHTAAAVLAREHPELALRTAAALTGESKGEVAVSIAIGWAQTSPSSAMQWAHSLPDSSPRHQAIEGTLMAWGRSDPTGMFEWLARQPAGRIRDDALVAASETLIDDSPDLATEVASLIANGATRRRVVERASRSWLVTDRAAARAWIAQTSLPPYLKVQLLGR